MTESAPEGEALPDGEGTAGSTNNKTPPVWRPAAMYGVALLLEVVREWQPSVLHRWAPSVLPITTAIASVLDSSDAQLPGAAQHVDKASGLVWHGSSGAPPSK